MLDTHIPKRIVLWSCVIRHWQSAESRNCMYGPMYGPSVLLVLAQYWTVHSYSIKVMRLGQRIEQPVTLIIL